MNKLTKIAIITSLIGFGLLLFVIASDAAYPDFCFRYGTGFGILFLLASLILFTFGWIIDFKMAIQHKNWTSAVWLLVLAGVMIFLLFFKRR
ncbi:MAG: hypothetical protein KHY89_05585 [Butyricicoccus pullicaecorum]|nr:hypothetical protein [Butyricicoccus pullicaecorum]